MENACFIEKEIEYQKFLDNYKPKPITSPYLKYLKKIGVQLNIDFTIDSVTSIESYLDLEERIKNMPNTPEKSIGHNLSYLRKYEEFAQSYIGTLILSTPMAEMQKAWLKYIEASDALKLLLEYGTNNIVGDFAEKLCVNFFNGIKFPNANKSADFEANGKLYQVKARKLNEKNSSTQLSVIRSNNFDYLIVVLFSKNGELFKVLQYNNENAKGKHSILQNGEIITTSQDFINKGNDLTNDFSKKFKIPIFTNKKS